MGQYVFLLNVYFKIITNLVLCIEQSAIIQLKKLVRV